MHARQVREQQPVGVLADRVDAEGEDQRPAEAQEAARRSGRERAGQVRNDVAHQRHDRQDVGDRDRDGERGRRAVNLERRDAERQHQHRAQHHRRGHRFRLQPRAADLVSAVIESEPEDEGYDRENRVRRQQPQRPRRESGERDDDQRAPHGVVVGGDLLGGGLGAIRREERKPDPLDREPIDDVGPGERDEILAVAGRPCETREDRDRREVQRRSDHLRAEIIDDVAFDHQQPPHPAGLASRAPDAVCGLRAPSVVQAAPRADPTRSADTRYGGAESKYRCLDMLVIPDGRRQAGTERLARIRSPRTGTHTTEQ